MQAETVQPVPSWQISIPVPVNQTSVYKKYMLEELSVTGKGLKGTDASSDASSAIADKSKIYIGKVDPR